MNQMHQPACKLHPGRLDWKPEYIAGTEAVSITSLMGLQSQLSTYRCHCLQVTPSHLEFSHRLFNGNARVDPVQIVEINVRYIKPLQRCQATLPVRNTSEQHLLTALTGELVDGQVQRNLQIKSEASASVTADLEE